MRTPRQWWADRPKDIPDGQLFTAMVVSGCIALACGAILVALLVQWIGGGK